jgi:putative ABC transport system permease protein
VVTSKLNLKLIRDLRFSPLMFGGIVLLVAVGVMLFVAAYSLYLNLQSSYATSYSRLNLADFSVQVQSAPQEVLSTLRQIPGVGEVEGRTIEEVEMEQPEMISRKVEGRIISLPDIGEPKLNQLKLLSGAYPRQDSARELLLESSFAGYYGYRPGDSLNIVILDDKVKFRIAGIVQSPEYIYVVRGRGYPLPNPRTFGVMWMRKGMVDEMFDTSGSVNDVEVGMAPGGNRRTAMRLASKILSPYGADEPVASENQASVELLRLDLAGHRRLAIFFPILFFTISSLSIYNLLGRMVYSQRSQIGFMRAVGFSRLAIGVHYLEFSIDLAELYVAI